MQSKKRGLKKGIWESGVFERADMLVFITGGWVFKRSYFLVKHKNDCFKIVIQW